MGANGQDIDKQAKAAIDAIRDNLLKPMHDSINANAIEIVKTKADEIMGKLEDIENNMAAQERQQRAFLNALSCLKWEK
ncbi:MAG: hypothetical protein ACOYOS_12910 [Syntrophales bacterium]